MEMSGLAALEQVGQKNQHLAEDRKKQTEKIYLVGCELLQRCRDNQFRDSQMICGAYDCFSFVIENNRTDPRAYVQMGYLFLCYHDILKATEYLKEALRLDPNQADAKKLLEYTQAKATRRMKGKNTDTVDSVPVTLVATLVGDGIEISDYDSLYDEVEMTLKEQIRVAFYHMNQLRPSPEPLALETIRKIGTTLKDNFAHLGQALEVLSEEFEMNELNQKYKQLEMSVTGLSNTLALSETFGNLKNAMLKLHTEAVAIIENKTPVAGQVFLADALFRLDALADELDGLEGAGYNIEPVAKYYNKLVQSIENVQYLSDGQIHDS